MGQCSLLKSISEVTRMNSKLTFMPGSIDSGRNKWCIKQALVDNFWNNNNQVFILTCNIAWCNVIVGTNFTLQDAFDMFNIQVLLREILKITFTQSDGFREEYCGAFTRIMIWLASVRNCGEIVKLSDHGHHFGVSPPIIWTHLQPVFSVRTVHYRFDNTPNCVWWLFHVSW